VVYNALVNSLHAQWNQYALNAGKHALSEKPFASNATEASLVRDVARAAPGQIVEGFHYLHHPVNHGCVSSSPPASSVTSGRSTSS
jgi:predicted dehydrogenase